LFNSAKKKVRYLTPDLETNLTIFLTKTYISIYALTMPKLYLECIFIFGIWCLN